MSRDAPVLVIEDDPFTRMLQVVLDPSTTEERREAFGHFFAHDLPDFAGWCEQMRQAAGALYPAEARLVFSQEELRERLPGASALVVESFQVGREELDAAGQLQAVLKFGVVTRNVDVAECQARGIQVLTQRRRANIGCAEHTLAMMLTLARKFHRIGGLISVEQLTEAGFSPTRFDIRHTAQSGWARISGLRMLYESTLGILGLGEIGQELALRAAPFGMRTLYYQRTQLPEAEERRLQAEYVPLERLLAESDWLSVQLPLKEDTRGFLGRAELAQMKPGAVLINTSRAEIVDREAVLHALASGRLGGFGLDTLYEEPGRPDDPLLQLDNVFLTPRTGAQPRFNTLRDTADIIRNLARALAP